MKIASAETSHAVEIDLLIHPQWIIPIEPAGITLTNHALAIDKGRILALLPCTEARQRYRPREVVELPGQVLLPGLVNLHTHAAMTLLRGYADDLPLMRWLSEHIWPAEGRTPTPNSCVPAACWPALKCCAAGSRPSTTCISFPKPRPRRCCGAACARRWE
jgi:5-methylthioadenosine/S-adenosylhomocysteine deaminase